MKLIFKIYKKVRELKREEREVKENIERYKKEEEIKLERKIEDAWKVYHQEAADFTSNLRSRDHILKRTHEDLHAKEAYIRRQHTILDEREQGINDLQNELNKREKELNSLQVQLNDQILKLGIFKEVNNNDNP